MLLRRAELQGDDELIRAAWNRGHAGARRTIANIGLIFITYLWSRDAVELDLARFSDFGHVQVAAEVEERI